MNNTIHPNLSTEKLLTRKETLRDKRSRSSRNAGARGHRELQRIQAQIAGIDRLLTQRA